MSDISFEYLKNTAFLGGLGTGCLKLYADGGTQFAGLAKSSARRANLGEHRDPVSFALCVKADGESASRCAILKTPTPDSGKESGQAEPVPEVAYAAVTAFQKQFPFANVHFDTAPCGISVQMNAFNPAIPQNSVDSGIPAAFFEFELTNLTEQTSTVTLGALLKSFFLSGKATPRYDKQSGAFYAELTETAGSVPARRRGSLCLATDAPNFTYEALGECDNASYFEHFGERNGFLSNAAPEKAAKNAAVMVACHVRLAPGQSEKLRFFVIWNFPYCAESPAVRNEKNYYCHYFSDIAGCVSYCFTHFERLRRESRWMDELAGERAGLPSALLPLLNSAFNCIKDPALRRDGAGVLRRIAEEGEEDSTLLSYTLEFLFPGITTATVVMTLKNLMTARGRLTDSDAFVPSAYDTDCTPRQLCARFHMVMRLFFAYRSCSELRFFTENWVDISCMVDLLCESAQRLCPEDDNFFDVYAAMLPALAAMIDMAELLRDKKRKMFYLERQRYFAARFDGCLTQLCMKQPLRLLSAQLLSQTMCAFTLCPPRILAEAVQRVNTAGELPDFFACAELARLGREEDCVRLAGRLEEYTFSDKMELYAAAMQAAVLIPAFSGFDYDKNTCSVTFAPRLSQADGEGVFRGFISFDGGFGRVEQGADYIELILYAGEVKIRRFTCAHRAYKAMYGGRMWLCDTDGGTVTLDSTLAVTKNKKLTVLIDTSKPIHELMQR